MRNTQQLAHENEGVLAHTLTIRVRSTHKAHALRLTKYTKKNARTSYTRINLGLAHRI